VTLAQIPSLTLNPTPAITPPNPSTTGFGTSVAVYEDNNGVTLVVGSIASAFAYYRATNAVTWTLQGTLLPNDATSTSTYGSSVAITRSSANTLFAGVTDPGWNNNQGRVALFSLSGSTWNYVTALTADQPTSGYLFGASLDMDGGNIAVGEPGANEVFYWTLGSTTVGTLQKVYAPANITQFGSSIVLGGSYSIIGANFSTGNGVVFFLQNTNSVWSITDTKSGGSQFGASFDVDNDGVALVTDLSQDYNPFVLIYEASPASSWSLQSTLSCPVSPCPFDYGFGNNVALAPTYAFISSFTTQYLYGRSGAIFSEILTANVQNPTGGVWLTIDFFQYAGAIGAPTTGAVYMLYGQCQNSGYYGQDCDVPCPSSCPYGMCSSNVQNLGQCTVASAPSSPSTGVIGGLYLVGIVGVVCILVAIAVIVYYKFGNAAKV